MHETECPAQDKRLVKIPGADHNTIFAVGWRLYLEAVQTFVGRLQAGPPARQLRVATTLPP
ncbi:MAG: hypothetical protein U5O69_00035 [Candidatus Competibacteraceae bacterium]|nr:hypothetical protein [Candidatus Competibacteraceae bacterium]